MALEQMMCCISIFASVLGRGLKEGYWDGLGHLSWKQLRVSRGDWNKKEPYADSPHESGGDWSFIMAHIIRLLKLRLDRFLSCREVYSTFMGKTCRSM